MPQSARTRSGVCAETVYLIVALASVAIAVVLWLVDVGGRGVFAILAALATGAFGGYLVRSAQAELIRRAERKAARDVQLFWEIVVDVAGEPEFIAAARTEGYAEGYVAGVRERLSRKGPGNQSN